MKSAKRQKDIDESRTVLHHGRVSMCLCLCLCLPLLPLLQLCSVLQSRRLFMSCRLHLQKHRILIFTAASSRRCRLWLLLLLLHLLLLLNWLRFRRRHRVLKPREETHNDNINTQNTA